MKTFVAIGLLCAVTLKAQPKPTYTLKTMASTVNGYPLNHAAVIEGAALSDTGEAALVVHWNENGRERTAVLTSKRIVAQDGDSLDGKQPLTRILPTSLQINSGGVVAYEAVIGSNPRQTAIFIERKYRVTLTQSGTEADFALLDNGDIALKSAIAAPLNTVPTPIETATETVKKGMTDRARKWLSKQKSPIPIPDPGVLIPKPTPVKQPAKMGSPASRPCPFGEWPFPPAWKVLGDEMVGPVQAHAFDPPAKARVYESPFFGNIAKPFRIVYTAADCRQLLVVVGDMTAPGKVEAWTPNGLLTHTNADGSLEGFPGSVLPGELVRTDVPFRINRRGQILLSINLQEGFAIVLATPRGGSR